MMYVVIGTAPTVDVSVAVGPFRSINKARAASDELIYRGYNPEMCPLLSIDEIESVTEWKEA